MFSLSRAALSILLCAFCLAAQTGAPKERLVDWHTPAVACSLLNDIGIKTRGYKNDPEWKPSEYFCSSPYTSIDERFRLELFIAYYVDGSRDTTRQLKLVMSIHDPRVVDLGLAALAVAADTLTRRVTGSGISDEIGKSVLSGTAGKWKLAGRDIEIQRENYRVGVCCYDLSFIIR